MRSSGTSPVCKSGRLLLLALVGALLLAGGGLIGYASVIQHGERDVAATASAGSAQTAQARALATREANAPQVIYAEATRGRPALADALSSQERSYWQPASGPGGSCSFSEGAYHVSAPAPEHLYFCYTWPDFQNFAFQVQMTIIEGGGGGLVFRASPGAASFYFFSIEQNSTYRLALYTGGSAGAAHVLTGGDTPAINTQPQQANMLTVIARASQLYLYVNRQYLATVDDGTLSAGNIGLGALGDIRPAQVAYRDARVWRLA